MFNTRNKSGISAHPCIILYLWIVLNISCRNWPRKIFRKNLLALLTRKFFWNRKFYSGTIHWYDSVIFCRKACENSSTPPFWKVQCIVPRFRRVCGISPTFQSRSRREENFLHFHECLIIEQVGAPKRQNCWRQSRRGKKYWRSSGTNSSTIWSGY